METVRNTFKVLVLCIGIAGYGCGGGDGDKAGGGGGAGDGGGVSAAPTVQELQDAMSVPGATKKSGTLPAGSTDPAAPQVTALTVPDSVGPGKLFQVTVQFRTGTAALAKMLVTLDGASGYFELMMSAIPNTDGMASFPMMFEEGKLGASSGGLAVVARGLVSTTKAITGTSVSLVVMMVDADGTGGEEKKSAMQVVGTAGACTGEGCTVTGTPDGGVSNDTGGDAGIPDDDGGSVTPDGGDAGTMGEDAGGITDGSDASIITDGSDVGSGDDASVIIDGGDAGSDDDAGIITDGGDAGSSQPRTIVPLYPLHGANLLDWVQGPDALANADAACDAATAGHDQCVHGGELRVITTDQASCAGLTGSDSLGVFDWTCREQGGKAQLVSTGFKAGKSLRDVVDFTSAVFRPLSVSALSGASPVFTSPAETLWDNPIVVDDACSYMTDSGAIHIVRNGTPAGSGWTFHASRIALLVDPTVVVHVPSGNAVKWDVSADFLWLEGAFRVNATSAGIGDPYAGTLRFATIRNLDLGGEAGTTHQFIGLNGFWSGRLQNIQLHGSQDGGVFITGAVIKAGHNLVEDIVLEGAALNVSAAVDSVYRRITTTGNGAGVFFNNLLGESYVSDVTAVAGPLTVSYLVKLNPTGLSRLHVARVVAVNSPGSGIELAGDNTTLQDALVVGSKSDGVLLGAARNNRLQNITVLNGEGGAAVHGGSGLSIWRGANGNVLRDITVVGNGIVSTLNHDGVVMADSKLNTLINVVSVNNAGSGLDLTGCDGYYQNTDNTFINLVLTDNADYGIYATTAAKRNTFTGMLRTGNNGIGSCEAPALAGNPVGIAKGAGADRPCLNALTSNASISTLTSGQTVDALFRGMAAGSVTAFDAITDFLPPTPFTGWVPDPTGIPAQSDGRRGRCLTGTNCALVDHSLMAAGAATGVNGAAPVYTTHTWDTGGANPVPCSAIQGAVDNVGVCTSVIVVNAHEDPTAVGGNQDALCDPGESCILTPNAGAYQGHGTLPNNPVSVSITGGTVTMDEYPTNGY